MNYQPLVPTCTCTHEHAHKHVHMSTTFTTLLGSEVVNLGSFTHLASLSLWAALLCLWEMLIWPNAPFSISCFSVLPECTSLFSHPWWLFPSPCDFAADWSKQSHPRWQISLVPVLLWHHGKKTEENPWQEFVYHPIQRKNGLVY